MYYQRFRKIIREEMIPIFLKSDDPEVVFFGQLLQENNISPHIFRHWYTTQLVLSGVNEVSELMSARGDNSPESAWGLFYKIKEKLQNNMVRLIMVFLNICKLASRKIVWRRLKGVAIGSRFKKLS